RQRPRLRPGLAEVPRARHCADLPCRRARLRPAQLAQQLHLQSCRPLRGGRGCQLFADLIEHWERRGAKGIAYMDPKKLDRALLRSFVDKYGYTDIAAELDRRDGWPAREEDEATGGVTELDDFAACKITRKEDWVDLYARPYYFGCEADDRMNVTAFGRANPFGARINAIFSSD